ncbi:MAG TPA: ATP-dependent acyl-CoA ligase [Steroidobacter sp.]|uniref:ATP-dependent acyl-CoA ligase n=1 Tax=Steroidobacter sp. TaxID=1978227 RepID=UPI002ED78391
MPRPILTSEVTVHDLLLARAAEHPNREFLVFEEQRFTYAQVVEQSRAMAGRLHAIGVRNGDRVALMMANRPEYLFAWFGCSMLGAVEVPVNTAHKGDFLAYVLDQAKCRAIVAQAAFWPQLSPLIEQLTNLEQAIILDGAPLHSGRVKVHALEDVSQDALPGVTVSADSPHAILFTSGTTGPSKGAVLPQQYPLIIGEIIARTVGYTSEDVLYNALPLFHGNAQFLSTVPALLAGARVVLARRFSASQFWDDIRRHRCTEFNYIGGIVSILMKAEPSPADRDHPLRVMMGAGAPKGLFREFEQRFGVRLFEGYGMSEIGIPLITDGTTTPPGSCGRPHPWYEVRLVDDEGRPVEDDTPGEALVRPLLPNAMLREYFEMPDRTVEAWRDLWFHTGDYLKRDSAGYYWFVDRKKDALRRRGENISSWEVERVVSSHPDVLESAAVAAPAEIGEDEVLVCVTLREGRRLAPAELIAWCEDRMPAFMVPRYVRILASLPKTPTERVQKFELRRAGVTADTWDRLAQTGNAS